MTATEPVPAIPAASLIVVRDGPPGLEVLLVERHGHARFAAGATVFPGGKLDPADAEAARYCPATPGIGDDVPLRVAAIRELFEECGVLLARAPHERALLDAKRVAELARAYRRELEAGRRTLAEVAAEARLVLAADELVPFAHWVTPEPLPRRFDTYFYLAALPPTQEAVFETGESVRLLWMTPGEAIGGWEAGELHLMLPTRMNLAKLGRSARVWEALEAARASRVVRVLPRVETTPEGPVLRIPAEAGYDVVEAPLDDVLRRPR